MHIAAILLSAALLQAAPTATTGDTQSVTNTSAVLTGTVTPDGHDEWQEASRSSAGTVLEHTFQGAGEFPYFCDPHRSVGMVGRVTVQ